MFGAIIMSIIIGTENHHLYQWSYLFFAIILTIGLILFLLLKNKYLVDNEGKLMKDNHNNSNFIINERNRFLQKISSKSLSEIKNLNIKERLSLINNSMPHKNEAIFAFTILLIISIFFRISFSQTSLSLVFFH